MSLLATLIVVGFIAIAVDRDQRARAELGLVLEDEWTQLENWLATA